jgi:hypothetical protein
MVWSSQINYLEEYSVNTSKLDKQIFNVLNSKKKGRNLNRKTKERQNDDLNNEDKQTTIYKTLHRKLTIE